MFIVLDFITSWMQKIAYLRYLKAFFQPQKYQMQAFKNIIKLSQGTEIFRNLGLDGIRTYDEYNKKCPITDFETYRSICDSIYNEQNSPMRMSPLPADYFVITSGTTSVPKYIPLQNHYRAEYLKTLIAWFGAIRFKSPKSFSGRSLYLADVSLLGHSPTGVMCGVFSGYNFRKLPKFIRENLYCTHENFYNLKDSKKTDICLLAHSFNAKLTLFGTIMPETIPMFLNKFFIYQDEILFYLENGLPNFVYPKEFENTLRLTPNPDTISRFKAIISKKHIESITEIYPHLATIICWKSSTAGFYLEKLKRIVPPHIHIWDGIYSATEAWFNFPLNYEEVGGPIAIKSHFYEFTEINDTEANNTKFLRAWELKDGHDYEVYVTSSMGFFRYRMYDRITVTGMFGKTPKIKFVEKTGEFLAFAMERITPSHVTSMVQKACTDAKVSANDISYFTLAPCLKSDLPHYTLFIECDKVVAEKFATVDFDLIMCDINPNYHRNIKGKLFRPIKMVPLQKGFIKNLIEERQQKGMSIAQFKYSPITKDNVLAHSGCTCG